MRELLERQFPIFIFVTILKGLNQLFFRRYIRQDSLQVLKGDISLSIFIKEKIDFPKPRHTRFRQQTLFMLLLLPIILNFFI